MGPEARGQKEITEIFSILASLFMKDKSFIRGTNGHL